MTMTVVHTIGFEAAHRLPKTPEGHGCRTLHGHSFQCDLHVTGAVEPNTGWIIDFATIQEEFEPLRKQLDHHTLNDIEGLENPTSENLAMWIWKHLKQKLPGLSCVVVHETGGSHCIYTGPDSG